MNPQGDSETAQKVDIETGTDDRLLKNQSTSPIDEDSGSFSLNSGDRFQKELYEKILGNEDYYHYRSEDVYNRLAARDKVLIQQINKIKKSMTKLSYELDVTNGKMRKKLFPEQSLRQNKPKKTTLNMNYKEQKKKASERLKFKNQNQKLPSTAIDKLEQLTGMEIDLYYKPVHPISTKVIRDGIKKTRYKNGDISLEYQDGTFRVQRGFCENIYFFNGDVEQRFQDGFSVHEYSSNGAIEAVLPSKITYIIFKTGQVELHEPNGTKTVAFGDGKYMRLYPDGKCEVKYKDGLPNDWPRLEVV